MIYYELDFSNLYPNNAHDQKFKEQVLFDVKYIDHNGWICHKDNTAYRSAFGHYVLMVRALRDKTIKDNRYTRPGWFCFRGFTSNSETMQNIIDHYRYFYVTQLITLDQKLFDDVALLLSQMDLTKESVRSEARALITDIMDNMILSYQK